MTIINCPWSACKYNSTKEIETYGKCLKKEVTLMDYEYENISKEFNVEYIECKDFKWDYKKFTE
jgi:hypothetical protein